MLRKLLFRLLQQIIDGYKKQGYTFGNVKCKQPRIQHVKQPEIK